MGMTHHACGTDNVLALINLALARGNVGRPGAGLMPVRGHSGVQGGAEMGAYATVFPGGVPIAAESARELERAYGFPIRAERGLSAAEMVEAAGRGAIDVLYSSGGNFLETLPDPDAVRAALERVPLRVHQDIVVSSQMLVDGWRFPTPDGRAHFVPVAPQELAVADGHFLLSTRRGKQFNTMVFKARDPLTGAARDALFMSGEDALELGLRDGDAVSVRSETG